MPKNWTSESGVGWVPVLYSCAEWVVLKSLEVTLWQPFFGVCVEVGSGNLSMRSIQQSLSMGVGCVEMYAYVKRNLGILRMECCASSSSQKVPAGQGPGLCRCTVLCGQVQTSSGEHSAQLLCQNLPTRKHFLLIYSSAVAETIVATLCFFLVSWKSLSWCCPSPMSLTYSDSSMNIFSWVQKLNSCAVLSSSCSSESSICPDRSAGLSRLS